VTRVQARRLVALRDRAYAAAWAEMEAKPGTPERQHLTRRARRLSTLCRAYAARVRGGEL